MIKLIIKKSFVFILNVIALIIFNLSLFCQQNIETIKNKNTIDLPNNFHQLEEERLKVIGEMYRVLKPSAHFSVSDIVLVGELPEALKQDAEMYAGCVAGAIQKDDYLQIIKEKGFKNIKIQKEKPIVIPNDILSKYLSEKEVSEFNKVATGIFSITVYAEKPGEKLEKKNIQLSEIESESCCSPKSGCC